MLQKAFWPFVITLAILAVLTSPPLVRPLLQQEATPTPTPLTPTITPTASHTPDPFANVPTATPQTGGVVIEVQSLPSPALGDLPPTFTPTPLSTSISQSPTILLPDPALREAAAEPFPAPTPATMPPDYLSIPRLALDVPVVPVGMVPVPGPGSYASPAMPSGRSAGWINRSASFDRPGNIVLTGRHQVKAMTIFHGLWTLESGDEIILSTGQQTRHYIVAKIHILPEAEQSLDVRLANAEYIQPTTDERLTLVSGWPEKGNSHRTVVIAFPE